MKPVRPAATNAAARRMPGLVRPAAPEDGAPVMGVVILVWCYQSENAYYPSGDVQYNADVAALQAAYDARAGIRLISWDSTGLDLCKPTGGSFPAEISTEEWAWGYPVLADWQASYNAVAAAMSNTPGDVYLCIDNTEDLYPGGIFDPHLLSNTLGSFITWLEGQGITAHYSTPAYGVDDEPYLYRYDDWAAQVAAALTDFVGA